VREQLAPHRPRNPEVLLGHCRVIELCLSCALPLYE
jgi:hypothetical protein